MNYFRRSRKEMVTFAECSDTSFTEETGKGKETGASLILFCKDVVKHDGRCPAAHTETDNVGSSLAAVGHAG